MAPNSLFWWCASRRPRGEKVAVPKLPLVLEARARCQSSTVVATIYECSHCSFWRSESPDVTARAGRFTGLGTDPWTTTVSCLPVDGMSRQTRISCGRHEDGNQSRVRFAFGRARFTSGRAACYSLPLGEYPLLLGEYALLLGEYTLHVQARHCFVRIITASLVNRRVTTMQQPAVRAKLEQHSVTSTLPIHTSMFLPSTQGQSEIETRPPTTVYRNHAISHIPINARSRICCTRLATATSMYQRQSRYCTNNPTGAERKRIK
ncbi:hypothetical protein BKA93DRAFT_767013 [Sparassis latifolia]